MRERFSEPLARWLDTLQHWPWLATLKTLRERFNEDRLGVTASSLTFTTTIALVPLFTVMLAVFSAFPIFQQFRGTLEKYFVETLVPNTIAQPVLAAMTQFANQASRLGAVGLVILALTALALMLTIDRALNNIWRVPKPRPIAHRVLVYWAAATLGPLLLGVSLSMTSYALSASQGLVEGLPGGVSFALGAAEFAALAGAMAALFRYVPNTLVRWQHAWAGGLFVAVGFEVAQKLLAWYLATVPSYSAIYGAFATVPIFLIWIYSGWVIVLLGAVIAAYAPSLQMRVVRRRSVAGYRFELAVAMLRELLRARGLSTHGLSAAELSHLLRTDPLQIEPILDTLVDIDWAGRLDEEGRARYVLLCNPATTPVQPLLAKVLLRPSPTLRNFWRKAGFDEMTLDELLAP